MDSTIILREVGCLELLRTAFRSLFVLRTGQRACEGLTESKTQLPVCHFKRFVDILPKIRASEVLGD